MERHGGRQQCGAKCAAAGAVRRTALLSAVVETEILWKYTNIK